MWEEQLKVNPEGTTSAQTPGPNYDFQECSTISKHGTKFGTGPRSYGHSMPNSPGKGPGPYIGRYLNMSIPALERPQDLRLSGVVLLLHGDMWHGCMVLQTSGIFLKQHSSSCAVPVQLTRL
jgi:hypothetical protein